MSLRLTTPAIAAAALLAVAGCAGGSFGGSMANNGADSFAAVAAPLPAGSPRVLTEADAGTIVTAAVGETIAVTLVGVPTAGYVWQAESVPEFLIEAETLSGPTSEAQNQPGFAGGNHWEVLSFRVAAPGEGQLVLAQRRPWESDEPASDTFTVNVQAQ